jgi:hypothetical protein
MESNEFYRNTDDRPAKPGKKRYRKGEEGQSIKSSSINRHGAG